MVARSIKIPPRIKRYIRENPGAFFVVCFQALLLMCAFLLIRGNSVFAERIAVWAYFSLVVGFLLQLVNFARRGREEGDER